VHYSDGQQETVTAGQLFYMQPHHLLTTEGGVVLAEFSRADDARQLFGHIASIMQAAG
jgi:hypothetical protein